MPSYFFDISNNIKSNESGPLRSNTGALLTTPEIDVKKNPAFIREQSNHAQRFLNQPENE